MIMTMGTATATTTIPIPTPTIPWARVPWPREKADP
jgi:hypothetical protein